MERVQFQQEQVGGEKFLHMTDEAYARGAVDAHRAERFDGKGSVQPGVFLENFFLVKRA
jgi:hypothetical protein